jgi:hypothetical protein
MSPDGTTFVFSPIPGSQKIFVLGQTCGQGCEEPKGFIYMYEDGTSNRITLSDEFIKEIKIESGAPGSPNGVFTSYSQLTYKGVDVTGSKFLFEYYQSTSGLNYTMFDSTSSTWQILGNTEPEGYTTKVSGVVCNPLYSFKDAVFKKDESCDTASKYVWEVVDRKILTQEVPNLQKKTISLPATSKKYSPFGWEDEQTISKLVFSGNYLWVATSRGLVRYSPESDEAKLIGSGEGLVGNEVDDVVIDRFGGVWSISHWAGMSFVPQD